MLPSSAGLTEPNYCIAHLMIIFLNSLAVLFFLNQITKDDYPYYDNRNSLSNYFDKR